MSRKTKGSRAVGQRMDTRQLEDTIKELETAISSLSTSYAPSDEVSGSEIGGLLMAMEDALEDLGAEDLSKRLGESAELIEAFLAGGATLNRDTARHFAERLLPYFRAFRSEAPYDDMYAPSQPEVAEWVMVEKTEPILNMISRLVELTNEVVNLATTTNLVPDERAFTEIEREALIAILETTLNVLKSPMIEKTLLKKASSTLKRAAAAAGEKQIELAFTTAASALGAGLVELWRNI